MPYNFEKNHIKLPVGTDRRRKLTAEDRERILNLYKTGMAIRAIEREMGKCSRRSIQYVIFPERYERAKAQFRERQQEGRYRPNRVKWAKTMREYRQRKKRVLIENNLN